MNILVTGGAGYIGSFMTKTLLDLGNNTVIVADSLEKGERDAIDVRAIFMQGNLKDEKFLEDIFSAHDIDAVIHFAGYISMGESMKNPGIYFENNSFATLNLLKIMARHNTKKFIFSSTAGVYGNPQSIPIAESHIKAPTNPYGESKLMVEQMLAWYQKIHGINFVALRYFNACGAALDGTLGEKHEPETHIIPNAIIAGLQGKEFFLFGQDYKTPDGTCIRDYIHVLDLVQAHMLALKKIENDKGGFTYNVGTGKGYSNKEVLDAIKEITKVDLRIVIKEARSGDADQLIADPTRIQQDLGFAPEHSSLETIIKTAWEWHRKNAKSKIQISK